MPEDVLYDIGFTNTGRLNYLELPDHAVADVDERLELLRRFPGLGGVYEPLYESAHPSFDAQVTYAGVFGIYYEIDARNRRVVVGAIVDQRMDPMARF